uniref:Putative chloroplast RF66 n=1 Tax=Pseudocrossidium replicatum TaxID=885028 RepID=A0A4P9CXV8_9BRYO|nr:putative chloroplast RF66 [Pseudocrossidium replicatum]QCT81841.1 putative chloroplast RF66 [Pseudocrossidium replicatum]
MIHIELGPSTIVGIGLIVVGILLYALRIREPNVSRYDSFFSSIGLLCGGILIFQGWRLDPILLLSQILLSGTTIFFIAESLYLRNNKINFTILSKKDFILEKKVLKKKINYQKIKLKKKNYKRWKTVDYTFFIFYKT